ncbi:MAG: hypothetical protein PVH11_07640 [Anaerolineae bacterium]|jgi:hypothetical protein
MIPYGELYVAEQTMHTRVKENIQEAESDRLKRQLIVGRQRWAGIMAWLGQRLVAYGERLQAHSESTSPSAMTQSANHLAS